MAATKKPATRRRKAQSTTAKVTSLTSRQKFNVRWRGLKNRTAGFLARRPHRSFRRTRRRDYDRRLQLPTYTVFTVQVARLLLRHRRTFLLLAVLYALFSAALVGLASQDTYTTLSQTLRDSSGDLFKGGLGGLGKAGLLLGAGVLGNFSTTPTDTQKIYAALIGLLAWLTTVWLLRSFLAGQKPRLRDGLYQAGAPLVPTALVALLGIVQLLPIAIAALGYSAAVATGFLNNGVEAMLFWVVVALLTTVSLYWLTSTFIALIVVTLPGMYPLRAIRTAGDLVIGRRSRLLLRLLWLLLTVAVAWIICVIPIILLDTWLVGVWPASSAAPVVPVALLIMSSLTIVWTATYVYLLYRKVVDDDAAPA